ncbi:transglutaminase-like cysteine peptidase [Vogesella sp. LIG4]|uniref:transglutaminase-like cysteine peptidase n=1 Tax=Vogesella sp. LIG4 TaxID=1192162 RepID=UPI001E44FD4D|nr:transglutaminase-like cysteine peptidase [Vogesella sp. LIG4]
MTFADRRWRWGWLLLVCSILLTLAGVGVASVTAERAEQLYGPQVLRIYRDWLQLVLKLGKEPSEDVKVREVNQFFNQRLRYVEDIVLWKQEDYWATPLEAMSKGGGDCEDYAFAKYFTLKELGIAPQKLRMIYVKARIGGPNSPITQAHMVLAYYPTATAEPLVLDSLLTSILPASQRSDLQPVFSFNAEGIWVGNSAAPNASADRLTRWRQLIDKMKAEGFIN